MTELQVIKLPWMLSLATVCNTAAHYHIPASLMLLLVLDISIIKRRASIHILAGKLVDLTALSLMNSGSSGSVLQLQRHWEAKKKKKKSLYFLQEDLGQSIISTTSTKSIQCAAETKGSFRQRNVQRGSTRASQQRSFNIKHWALAAGETKLGLDRNQQHCLAAEKAGYPGLM